MYSHNAAFVSILEYIDVIFLYDFARRTLVIA